MKKGMMGVLVVVGIFLLVFPSMAQQKISEILIASEEWKNATNTDGTGMYWEIFRAIFEPAGIKVKPMIRSYEGTMELARQQKVDAAVGAYINEQKGVLFPKAHFGVDVVAVAYKKGKLAEWKGEASLANKNIGWVKGYSFDEYLDVKVNKMEFETREDIMRVLEKDRLDFFMDAQADILDTVEKGSLDLSKFEIKEVKRLNLYLVFANNAKGQQLLKIFDENIQKLVASGEFKKICQKWEPKYLACPY
jgi:polar amino acid transport system substrate-binding protein